MLATSSLGQCACERWSAWQNAQERSQGICAYPGKDSEISDKR